MDKDFLDNLDKYIGYINDENKKLVKKIEDFESRLNKQDEKIQGIRKYVVSKHDDIDIDKDVMVSSNEILNMIDN